LRKVYVDGVGATIIAERVEYLDENGKLVTESLRDFTKTALKKRFASLDNFLKRWKGAERKQANEMIFISIFPRPQAPQSRAPHQGISEACASRSEQIEREGAGGRGCGIFPHYLYPPPVQITRKVRVSRRGLRFSRRDCIIKTTAEAAKLTRPELILRNL
jgi:hypothetical protein